MTVARPVVVACGDILGVAFDGEDEAVLFAPHSGDVLISEVAQWRELIAPRTTPRTSPGTTASTTPGNIGPVDNAPAADAASLAGDEAPASELRATLRQLGVQFG